MQNINLEKILKKKTVEFTIGKGKKKQEENVFYLPYSVLDNDHVIIGLEKINRGDCLKNSKIIGVEIKHEEIKIIQSGGIPTWKFNSNEENIFIEDVDVVFSKVGNALLYSRNNANIILAIEELTKKIRN